MQLTIDRYTQLVAPIDVRDLDLANAFLTFWSFEEFWHGAAIAEVLRAHGELAGAPRVKDFRRSRRAAEAVKPFGHGLASMVVGSSMTAVHMTWGAINEWTTQAAYARLAAKCDHPVLSEMLRRIMRQEGRHIDFYRPVDAAIVREPARPMARSPRAGPVLGAGR